MAARTREVPDRPPLPPGDGCHRRLVLGHRPLTASASAPALARAFWRNALGFITLGPLLLVLRRREVGRIVRGHRGVVRRAQWRPIAVGFLAAPSLALHFATFMTSTG